MSYYLERNRELIAEVNDEIRHGFVFDQKEVAKNERGTTLYSLGNYPSRVLARDLYLGYKDYRSARDKAIHAIGIQAALVEEFPQLGVEVPVITGLLHSKAQGDLGVLVQDASEGGRLQVQQIYFIEETSPELHEFNPKLDEEQLTGSSFWIKDTLSKRRMILDVGLLAYGLTDRNERLKLEELINTIDMYTVRS